MVERQRTLQELHARRQAFVVKAIEQGAYLRKPEGVSQRVWDRSVNIGVARNLGLSTFERLGSSYDKTWQLARLDNIRFLSTIWESAPQAVQEEYPLSEFLSPKPRAKKERACRSKLKVERFLKVIEEMDNDHKVQEEFDHLSNRAIIRYCSTYPKNSDRPNRITVLKDVIMQGFRYSPRYAHLFADSIGRHGIPIKKARRSLSNPKIPVQNYYYLLARDSQRALNALETDEALTPFKILSLEAA